MSSKKSLEDLLVILNNSEPSKNKNEEIDEFIIYNEIIEDLSGKVPAIIVYKHYVDWKEVTYPLHSPMGFTEFCRHFIKKFKSGRHDYTYYKINNDVFYNENTNKTQLRKKLKDELNGKKKKKRPRKIPRSR